MFDEFFKLLFICSKGISFFCLQTLFIYLVNIEKWMQHCYDELFWCISDLFQSEFLNFQNHRAFVFTSNFKFKIMSFLQWRVFFQLFCSDFRNGNNKIFELGVCFFSSAHFDFLNSHFDGFLFISFQSYCCPKLKIEKMYHLWSFFVKLWGFKDCHFSHFWTINAWYISRYQRVSANLIRPRNRSKLVQGSLYALIFRFFKKSITLYLIWRVEGFLYKKAQFLLISILFCYIYFFHVFTAVELKSSRKIQGFALIRAVLS